MTALQHALRECLYELAHWVYLARRWLARDPDRVVGFGLLVVWLAYMIWAPWACVDHAAIPRFSRSINTSTSASMDSSEPYLSRKARR